MTPVQAKLVERRANLIRLWPVVGVLMALMLGGLYTFAFLHLPVTVDPATLAAKVQAGQVDMEAMARMAIVGGVALIACGVFIFTLLFIISLSLLNEWRLIAVIRAQESELERLRPATSTAESPADGV
jgi:hypothetical protein